jgi:hypothetical protein
MTATTPRTDLRAELERLAMLVYGGIGRVAEPSDIAHWSELKLRGVVFSLKAMARHGAALEKSELCSL